MSEIELRMLTDPRMLIFPAIWLARLALDVAFVTLLAWVARRVWNWHSKRTG